MPTQIYLGCDLTEKPIYLQFYEAWFPSLLIVGAPGSWKSLSVARSLIETLIADNWTCIYVTITADWLSIQNPNLNPLDVETLKQFHSDWFLHEADWKTHGINKDRITLLLSPFWRGNLGELEATYGLKTVRWSIPVWNVMLEAVQDFYGSEAMLDTGYFKEIREVWEDVRSNKTNKEEFVNALMERVESLPSPSKEWGIKFVDKIKEWFEMKPDPILTDTNMLNDLLNQKGKLLLFYFPQEEITAIESATLATFIYTVMDVCGRYYLKKGIKYCIIVDDYGTWHHHKRSKQAAEALIQRKGRKMGLLRALIAQTEDDLKDSTIFDSIHTREPTFDFRVDATINNAEINGVQCLRGSVMYLHLRKHIHTRQGIRTYHPLLFVSRPPLTAYQLRLSERNG
jgi:hypothetical protein